MANTQIELQDPLRQSFGTIRMAKNICMILVLLCLLGELKVAVLTGFWGIGLPVIGADTEIKTYAMIGLLGAGQVIAPAACLITAIALLLAAMLALQAKAGGTGNYISGFFWSIVLLLVLTPWQQFMQGLPIMGALSSFQAISDDVRDCSPSIPNAATWHNCSLYYARYLAYPVFTIMLWTVVMVKFTRGFKATFPKPVKAEPLLT